MKQLRTASFRGHEYRFWVHDEESISAMPGIGDVESSRVDVAGATAANFENESEVRERHWLCGPRDVVIDGGACFGSYALTAAAQGATVIAFEPEPVARMVLHGNVAANPGFAEHVDVHPWAIGAFNGDDFNPVPIDSMDLDPVTFIKLDVEGHELEALVGATATLRRFRPRLLIENHEFLKPGIGRACQLFLEAIGLPYTCVTTLYPASIEYSHSYYEPI